MAIPNNSKGMGDLFRLSSLKNVSGRRRVMPGAEFLDELEPPPQNIGGIAAPMENQNLPQNDLGGQLTTQSYDVRANQAMPPEVYPEEDSFYTRLGKAFGNLQQQNAAPMQETPPVQEPASVMPENLPENIGQEEDVFSRLAKAFAPQRPGGEPADQETIQMAQNLLNGENVETQAKDEEIQAAIQNPDGQAVHGATEMVAQNPELAQSFEQQTGVNIQDPQVKSLTEAYEAIISGQEDILAQSQALTNEQITGIKQRIETNSATDADKFYIGLALLMPLVVGGVFGAEAGLGALAGGAKGFGEVLGRRQENIASDEEKLAALNKQRSDLGLKKGELDIERQLIPSKVAKALPSTEHIKGFKDAIYLDPETGKEEPGKEVLPGMVVRADALNNEKDVTFYRTEAKELLPYRSYTDKFTDLAEEFVELTNQLDDPNIISKGLTNVFENKASGLNKAFSKKGKLKGREVNLATELDSVVKQIHLAISQADKQGQMDAALTRTMNSILANPYTSFATPQESISTITRLLDGLQDDFINKMEQRGFSGEQIIDKLLEKNQRIAQLIQ